MTNFGDDSSHDDENDFYDIFFFMVMMANKIMVKLKIICHAYV